MTWHYTHDQQARSGTVWDHSGSKVEDGYDIAGSGVPSANGRIPDFVFDVMYREAMSEYTNSNIQEALRIVAEAAFEDIEQGKPEDSEG